MMGTASFSWYAEMLSMPVALLTGIFWINFKTSWHDTSVKVKLLSDDVK